MVLALELLQDRQNMGWDNHGLLDQHCWIAQGYKLLSILLNGYRLNLPEVRLA